MGKSAQIPAFEAICESMIAEGRAERSTMMGHPCLRVNGAFFATAGHKGDELILKMPAERVAYLIDAGTGEPFAPAGKVFKEWIAISHDRENDWPKLADEARDFVARSGK